MSVTRSLYVMSAVLAVTGIALRLAPLGRPAVDASPVAGRGGPQLTPRPASSVAGDIGSATAEAVVAANIFARSRVAPTRPGTVTTHQRPAPMSPPAPTFTLYGTTSGPEGAIALIDAGAPPRGAQMHRLGDTIAGARLVGITDSTVTLARQSGPLVLHLPSIARPTP